MTEQPAGQGMLPPLVESKLLPPRSRTGLVDRPRVVHLLDGADGAALTLLSAPTGYGKTIAVRAWCDERSTAFAWITLDAGDNDPLRLWTYVATAVNRIRDGVGRAALQRLGKAEVAIEFVIDDLANGIGSFGEPLVVVVDELHLVDDTTALSSFEHFIERLPSNARVLALTRTDPPIQLGRHRGRGALVELRAAELAFSVSEAQELLVDRGQIALTGGEVEVLVARTEGWPAGLYLAALWLRGHDNPGEGAREFAGSHRHVVGYLSGEVLEDLDSDMRSFLLRSSVLGRFTAELCDAVLERTDSAETLATIERRNLFLVPLDGHGNWFRYHALFAELLALELAANDPGAAPDLHRRASTWFEERGLIVEAAEHAGLAGDHMFVANLLIRSHLQLHLRPATFLRWVETLPDEILVEHPLLPAIAAIQAGRAARPPHERRRFLALADRARAEHPERFGPHIDAAVAVTRVGWIDRNLGEALRYGLDAIKALKKSGDPSPLFVPLAAGLSHTLYLAGELDEAGGFARAAADHPDAPQREAGYAVALAVLALVAAEQGRVTTARVHVDAAASLIRENGLKTDWVGGIVASALAVVFREEGELSQAEREAETAESIRRTQGACVELAWTLVLSAGIQSRRGRLVEARSTLEEAHEILGELADAGRIGALVAVAEAELADALETAAAGELLEQPTEAELAVLRLLASDLTLNQIANELFLSVNTIKTHRRVLYRKLGVNSRTEAIARAGVLELISPESPG